MGKDYLYSTGTRNRNDALKLLKQKQDEVNNTVSIDETVSKVIQLLGKTFNALWPAI